MTVTLNLPSETERRLREKAAQCGQTLEKYLETLVDDATASVPASLPPDQWIAEFRAWAASHKSPGRTVDDSRESIYEGRGE